MEMDPSKSNPLSTEEEEVTQRGNCCQVAARHWKVLTAIFFVLVIGGVLIIVLAAIPSGKSGFSKNRYKYKLDVDGSDSRSDGSANWGHTESMTSNCYSQACQEIMRQTKLSMDAEVKPCDDFYKYACGTWVKTMKPTKNGTSRDSLSDVSLSNILMHQTIIEFLRPQTDPERKLLTFYHSCVNQNKNGIFNRPDLASNFAEVDATTEFIKEGERVLKTLEGDGMNASRSKEELLAETDITHPKCFIETMVFFKVVIERLFVQNILLRKEKMLSNLIESIRLTFISKIGNISWMDGASKPTLKRRFHDLPVLGYSPKEPLYQAVEYEIFKDVQMTENNYKLNKLLLELNNRKGPDGKKTLRILDDNDNTYYITGKILGMPIPAGLVQQPFADKDYPALTNYAKLGWIIAHEFAHHLSTLVKGKVTQLIPSIVSEASLKYYDDRRQCIEDQYKDFRLFSEIIPNTTEEDFADVVGLQVAFQAFIDNYGKDYETLPGFEEFTKEQLFFISSAQVFCRSFATGEEDNVLKKQVATDRQSPNRLRIFGSMRNSREFNTAFNCSLGSPYNPSKKCDIFE